MGVSPSHSHPHVPGERKQPFFRDLVSWFKLSGIFFGGGAGPHPPTHRQCQCEQANPRMLCTHRAESPKQVTLEHHDSRAFFFLCPLVMLLESKTSHRTIFIAPRIPHVHRHDFSSQDALWLTPGSVYTYLASLRCNCQVREQRLTFRVSRGDTNTYTNNGVRSFASVTSRT